MSLGDWGRRDGRLCDLNRRRPVCRITSFQLTTMSMPTSGPMSEASLEYVVDKHTIDERREVGACEGVQVVR